MARRRDVPGPGAATDEDYSVEFEASTFSPEKTAAYAAEKDERTARLKSFFRDVKTEFDALPRDVKFGAASRRRAWLKKYRAAQEAAR